MIDHADVLIVGGGPVGATLALALQGSPAASPLKVALLEARADVARGGDPRALALSYGSMLLLRQLGVWQCLPEPTPIETIHISQKAGLGRMALRAADEGLPALGYVVDYGALDRALHQALLDSGATYLTGASVDKVAATHGYGLAHFRRGAEEETATARLLVLADGGRSLGDLSDTPRQVREYGQRAVVAHVESEIPHGRVAYERFTPQGPAALLPSGGGMALVWTTNPGRAEELCALPEDAFLTALHEHFGDRLGRFLRVGPRNSFPLLLRYTHPVARPHTVLIGNAAQTLHPVAGQGFNLGLRDAWELAETCRAFSRAEIGSSAMLERYRQRRRLDTGGGILFTDALVRVFSNDRLLLRHGRGLALSLLQAAPPLKSFVARRMIFGARGL